MDIWVSYLATFMAGALTGAAGQYLADKYSDQRRDKEAKRALAKSFHALSEKMPALMREMRDDLLGDATDTVREFYILRSPSVTLSGIGKNRFSYFQDQHEQLREKVDLLEGAGFVVDITPSDIPIFRMNESFVSLLKTALRVS